MVRVDRGCNIDRELDLARLMEPLRKQPSLAWGEFESCKLHRGAEMPTPTVRETRSRQERGLTQAGATPFRPGLGRRARAPTARRKGPGEGCPNGLALPVVTPGPG